MKKSLKKVIIFDLDDTLYKEREFVEGGFKDVAKYMEERFNIKKADFYKLLLKVLEKQGRGHVFDSCLKEHNLYSKKIVDKLVKTYRLHKPNIKLYPSVKTLLSRFEKNYKLALITDGLKYVQQRKVKALGLEKLFDLIIYTDAFGKKKSKPSPYSFNKVLKYFNISRKQAVYIGDDPNKDFIGARKIGIKTIRILQGRFKDIKAEKGFEADYSIQGITNTKEIENILLKLIQLTAR